MLVAPAASFAFELAVNDAESVTRRRLIFSTAFRDATSSTLHAQVPLPLLPRGVWLNFTIDVADLVQAAWPGAAYGTLEGISLAPSCKLRNIFTLQAAPQVSHAALDDPPPEGQTYSPTAAIPRAQDFAVGLAERHATIIINTTFVAWELARIGGITEWAAMPEASDLGAGGAAGGSRLHDSAEHGTPSQSLGLAIQGKSVGPKRSPVMTTVGRERGEERTAKPAVRTGVFRSPGSARLRRATSAGPRAARPMSTVEVAFGQRVEPPSPAPLSSRNGTPNRRGVAPGRVRSARGARRPTPTRRPSAQLRRGSPSAPALEALEASATPLGSATPRREVTVHDVVSTERSYGRSPHAKPYDAEQYSRRESGRGVPPSPSPVRGGREELGSTTAAVATFGETRRTAWTHCGDEDSESPRLVDAVVGPGDTAEFARPTSARSARRSARQGDTFTASPGADLDEEFAEEFERRSRAAEVTAGDEVASDDAAAIVARAMRAEFDVIPAESRSPAGSPLQRSKGTVSEHSQPPPPAPGSSPARSHGQRSASRGGDSRRSQASIDRSNGTGKFSLRSDVEAGVRASRSRQSGAAMRYSSDTATTGAGQDLSPAGSRLASSNSRGAGTPPLRRSTSPTLKDSTTGGTLGARSSRDVTLDADVEFLIGMARRDNADNDDYEELTGGAHLAAAYMRRSGRNVWDDDDAEEDEPTDAGGPNEVDAAGGRSEEDLDGEDSPPPPSPRDEWEEYEEAGDTDQSTRSAGERTARNARESGSTAHGTGSRPRTAPPEPAGAGVPSPPRIRRNAREVSFQDEESLPARQGVMTREDNDDADSTDDTRRAIDQRAAETAARQTRIAEDLDADLTERRGDAELAETLSRQRQKLLAEQARLRTIEAAYSREYGGSASVGEALGLTPRSARPGTAQSAASWATSVDSESYAAWDPRTASVPQDSSLRLSSSGPLTWEPAAVVVAEGDHSSKHDDAVNLPDVGAHGVVMNSAAELASEISPRRSAEGAEIKGEAAGDDADSDAPLGSTQLSDAYNGGDLAQQSVASATSVEESGVELVYDEILNCFQDPVTGRYYDIAE